MIHNIHDDEEIVDAELVDDEPHEITPVTPEGYDTVSIPLSGVADLRRAFLVLDDERKTLAEAGDVDRLAYGVADIASIVGDLNTIKRSAEADIAAIMLAEHGERRGNPKHEVPGLGVIDVPGGTERKGWESRKLLERLVRDVVADPETGELRHFESPVDVAEAITAMIVDCLSITPSTAWKVGTKNTATGEWDNGLRGRGIDPGDWCDVVEKPRLAKVPKRQDSAR